MNIFKLWSTENVFNLWSTEKVCRTRMISQDLFECKVKKPNPRFCECSLCMGDSFICKHPDREVFSKKK